VRRLALAVVIGLNLVGCGGNSSPTAPTPPPPPPAPIVVTISGASTLRNGRAETFTASAGGCSWSSSDSAILTVSSSGEVRPVGVGQATIACDVSNGRGTKTLTVIPDFQGTWRGSYVVAACEPSGWAIQERACQDVFAVGNALPMSLNLTQDGDRVSGTFAIGSLAATAQGPIDANNELTVFSTNPQPGGQVTYTITWRLRSDRLDRITGTIFLSGRAASFSGELRVLTNVRELVR
jgi:hypothetical protein